MAETTFPATVPLNTAAIDALVKANKAAAKGFAELASHFFESASRSFENAMDMNRKLTSVKSVAELAELQTKLVQESLETALEHGKALSELTTTLAKDIAAPLSNLSVAVPEAATSRKAGTAKAA